MERLPCRVLAIGGSDSGGSAGIQADLKTYAAHRVFGMSALTVVTAQNTCTVQKALPLPLGLIQAQIVAVLEDMQADAIKTGLLGRADVVQLVAELVADYGKTPFVVDPVLVNGAGQPIVDEETVNVYRRKLFPLSTVITPNLDEARWLTDMTAITTENDLRAAARRLHALGPQAVLVKGGHLEGPQKVDLFFDGREFVKLTAPTLPVDNPHGVGCTFASAIAAGLALNTPLLEAVRNAHAYLQRTLRGALNWQIGRGRTPVNHQGL